MELTLSHLEGRHLDGGGLEQEVQARPGLRHRGERPLEESPRAAHAGPSFSDRLWTRLCRDICSVPGSPPP